MDKPYRYDCKKHGKGWAEIDECPQCMNNDYLDMIEMDNSCEGFELCAKNCENFDGDYCSKYPQFDSVEFFGRRKKCKHYKYWVGCDYE